MFLTKYCVVRAGLFKPLLARNASVTCACTRIRDFDISAICNNSKLPQRHQERYWNITHYTIHRKWYSNGLPDAENSEIEVKRIRSLFPEPRMTLNNLSAKTPARAFEVHYKQHVAPAGLKRKMQNLDWTCTYHFVWPEKMKFEGTGVSKREAGETAALRALHWLISCKRIDTKGCPVYHREELERLQSGLSDHIHAEIGPEAVETFNELWHQYENGIREIYDRTAEDARHSEMNAPAHLARESTVDEDEFSESERCGDEVHDLSEADGLGAVHPVFARVLTPPSPDTLLRRTLALEEKFAQYQDRLAPLPIDQYAEEITSTLRESRAVVIEGAAGCGKSSRVPALVLRAGGAACACVVSEPRRVAAVGLAERVATELREQVGESVGYQVRLECRPPRPPAGAVLFCTSGILLNRLQTDPGLEGCSHVIIDEAHERDVNTDVTLLLLKRALLLNERLKLIIMSATLHTAVFTSYFDDCPVIRIPGRTFPVEVFYLEDIEKRFNIRLPNTLESCKRKDGRPQLNIAEIVETIKAVDRDGTEGAILVFLPGWAEIKRAQQLLLEHYKHSDIHMIVPVHSRLSMTEQSRMFYSCGSGVRKILLATNVAETCVTVPDVTHVIDAGARREHALHERTGRYGLELMWVSQANATQRAGRAGRVQPGNCYRLYTKEKEQQFEVHNTPQILRVPLERTVLECKRYAPSESAHGFLAQLPQPPPPPALDRALTELRDIGALSECEGVTRAGAALVRLGLPPRAGLALLHAAALGTALPLACNAALRDVQLFRDAPDRTEEIREIKRSFSATSDHVALYRLQRALEGPDGHTLVHKYRIRQDHVDTVTALTRLYMHKLVTCGVVCERDESSGWSESEALVSCAVLGAGRGVLRARTRLGTRTRLRTRRALLTSSGEPAHVASCSVNGGAASRVSAGARLVAWSEGARSSSRRALVVRDTSALSASAALLRAGGPLHSTPSEDGRTTVLSLVKHDLDVHVPTHEADALMKAREMISRTVQYYLERDVERLRPDEWGSVATFRSALLAAIAQALGSHNTHTD